VDARILHLIATVIDACGQPGTRRRGHPPTATVRVLAALRRFLREGTPWRSLVATADQASGATLRRCLARWAETGLLARVHAMLVGMLRGHPDLILDTCSVRAKRGGALTGPNPTDRAKRGTKYHVAVDGDGVPGLRGHRGQRQRHARLRAAVPGRLRRDGAHPHGVRRQGL